jgi:hypothetical protein
MSSVKYNPQSLPANTCCGKFGLAIIESIGTFGRLPLLFSQVNVAQFAVHVTRYTCPGVLGVFWSNPPSAAYPTSGFTGSVATSSTGLFGSTELPPVTFTQVALFAVPCPSPKPYCTFPSLVPTMAVVDKAAE